MYYFPVHLAIFLIYTGIYIILLLFLTFSWHVRNQNNKERVRKDEENARLEEKKEQERIDFAVSILKFIRF